MKRLPFFCDDLSFTFSPPVCGLRSIGWNGKWAPFIVFRGLIVGRFSVTTISPLCVERGNATRRRTAFAVLLLIFSSGSLDRADPTRRILLPGRATHLSSPVRLNDDKAPSVVGRARRTLFLYVFCNRNPICMNCSQNGRGNWYTVGIRAAPRRRMSGHTALACLEFLRFGTMTPVSGFFQLPLDAFILTRWPFC